jgi:hypothetical protein
VINWAIEWPKIRDAAVAYGLDPYFIMAIRHTENGGPGREFGVLSEHAPTYDKQLQITCISVRNFIDSFHDARVTELVMKKNLITTLAYASGFVAAFAKKWAPLNVANDPNKLNQNWYDNCYKYYRQAKYEDSLA